jgi:hypothetical protein
MRVVQGKRSNDDDFSLHRYTYMGATSPPLRALLACTFSCPGSFLSGSVRDISAVRRERERGCCAYAVLSFTTSSFHHLLYTAALLTGWSTPSHRHRDSAALRRSSRARTDLSLAPPKYTHLPTCSYHDHHRPEYRTTFAARTPSAPNSSSFHYPTWTLHTLLPLALSSGDTYTQH